jgi:ATP-dependent helicase/nuclease subunit B
MKPFVTNTAAYIIDNELPFEHLTIVLPSQRMTAYMQRALFEAVGKPILLPRIITIDMWMQELIDTPMIDKTEALFELYRVFQQDPIEYEITTFDAFISWGQLLLSDFDEIDRYLVAPDQLFKNLKDVREIENWSFNSEELSLGQQKFMAFWDKLGPYYHAFSKILVEKEATTKGKIYRKVAENIDLVFQKNKKEQFVFAGFNALSEAELSIFKQLKSSGRGHILIDSDAFYLNDNYHEAGTFHRTLLDRLQVKSLPFIHNELREKSATITLVECPQVTGQAAVIGTLLGKLSPAELDETLVLLANEQLLGSLLHHLPKSIGKANITLGMPLKHTSLKLWIELIFRVQEAIVRRGTKTIYHKEFIQFVHHPYVLGILDKSELKKIRAIETKIVRQNWHFIAREELDMSPKISALSALLFTPWKNNWHLALAKIQELCRLLDEWLTAENTLEKSAIRTFSAAIVGLENLLQTDYPPMSLGTFKTLFQQHWSGENLAYFGNPLDGLQIMGLLETRGLDFKRILVLGLNEGTMPPTNPIQTLIPMDLRRFFGLPTPRDKQGLFAHHFYRLLHTAETVAITYTSASEAIGSNEPSRFIQQLSLELATVNPNFVIEKQFYTLGNQEEITTVSIDKTPEIIARLNEFVAEGLTFTKMDAFLRCPLNFYYRYILRIGEENKIEEEIEANTLGTIIHEVLEKLFEPYVLKKTGSTLEQAALVITIDRLQQMKKAAPLLIDDAYYNHFSKDKSLIETGVNHINYVMTNEVINKILDREIDLLKANPEKSLFIAGLEKDLAVETVISVNGSDKKVRIHGVLDRIDQWGGEYRIIDYKSGGVTSNDIKINATKAKPNIIENIISSKEENDKNYALQLLIYCYLYKHNFGKELNFSGIFSFINVSESPFYLNLNALNGQNPSDLIEAFLEAFLTKLFDETVPFAHNHKAQYCEFC